MHNNNRAGTVLRLFHKARMVHGTPRRVRGDHGTENISVARWVDDHCGAGSYIWGRYVFCLVDSLDSLLFMSRRSVHNTRAERLWGDFIHGIISKWKPFFEDLELNHGLDPNMHAHIWLLHWLFLDVINEDVQEWREAWNHHQITLPGGTCRSPRDMFIFSILLDGARGMESLPASSSMMEGDQLADEDSPLPLLESHIEDGDGENGEGQFSEDIQNLPANMSEVICEVPDCPVSEDWIEEMRARICAVVDLSSRNMMIRRFMWQVALQTCQDMQADNWCVFLVRLFLPCETNIWLLGMELALTGTSRSRFVGNLKLILLESGFICTFTV